MKGVRGERCRGREKERGEREIAGGEIVGGEREGGRGTRKERKHMEDFMKGHYVQLSVSAPLLSYSIQELWLATATHCIPISDTATHSNIRTEKKKKTDSIIKRVITTAITYFLCQLES